MTATPSYFQAAAGERNSPFLDKTDDGRLSIVRGRA